MTLRRNTLLIGGLVATAGLLAGCSTEGSTIVVGSQAYYSNEIVAEVYAQALEADGHTVERNFQIGQREAYLPALEAGEVQLFPEYTGNLLQYYSPDATATQADEVYSQLQGALPENLQALAMSPATDQDSYNVTAEFAEANGLVEIGDLAGVTPLVLGGAPELEERPYGPDGLLETYGVEADFSATGEVTLEALLSGEVQVANIYTGNPAIAAENLVTLADPEGLFLSSNLVPIASEDVADSIAPVINPISEAMSPGDLVAMNLQSTADGMSSADIAAEWLAENGF
ncbi:ABC transporter substrate-binding protein [Pontimonas sp.]|jgi:osmoprotectant transport system substrate-binding protein|uniref:ABC transporter substrate-binding protein n=1 Tax=Pontimonas sp. TaxID=2304492 RepID=UPI00286FC962|nr:ABC transporter substrate-binding protein [Pontimonas sp.]MDR9434093.1 ABC transporter substrate-binding protein [Pontimonas sp.]